MRDRGRYSEVEGPKQVVSTFDPPLEHHAKNEATKWPVKGWVFKSEHTVDSAQSKVVKKPCQLLLA
jgi:hypothetical protein